MAGLWERVKPGGGMSVHLLEAAFVLYGTGEFTSQQILDALNGQLSTPLAGAELTDLDGIRTQLDGQLTTTAKLVYLEKVKAITLAGQIGSINEAKFRSVLGIA